MVDGQIEKKKSRSKNELLNKPGQEFLKVLIKTKKKFRFTTVTWNPSTEEDQDWKNMSYMFDSFVK